jgi:hypothetical protein
MQQGMLNCSVGNGRGLRAYFACPFRIMWIIAIPPRITRILIVDLNPGIGLLRHLMVRRPLHQRGR